MIEEKACAKINLDLFVTGKRVDGYHLLDSLVVFSEFGDKISVTSAPELSLDVTGPYAEAVPTDRSNLVLQAAIALQKALNLSDGAIITLEKNIPAAAGVGGGSTDAAATLRALMVLWGVSMAQKDLMALCLSLGADIPVCMVSESSIMSGVGEGLYPVPNMPHFGILLVNPGVSLSTPVVFKMRDEKFSEKPLRDFLDHPMNQEDFLTYSRTQQNDLYDAACKIAPIVRDVVGEIGKLEGCLLSRMSGSGATCFGLFKTAQEAEEAEKALKLRDLGWWVKSSVTKF